MTALQLVPLGVGDAFSARWYSSSFVLRTEDAALLVDCPHPIRKMLREASACAGVPLALDGISGVVLTHLHADHASGLEGAAYFSYFVLERRLRLLAHPEVTARLWSGQLAGSMEEVATGEGGAIERTRFEDFFDLVPLDEDVAVEEGPFRIECRRTIHPIPTYALRVSAAGRSVGYSADTAWDPDLLDWLGAADLIVHETNEGPHTPYERLAELPDDVRRRIRLIHYPDDFDLGSSAIEPLEQGRAVEV